MATLSKVIEFVARQEGAKLIRLKEAWIEGKGYIQMPVPLVKGFHTHIDIERNVQMMIEAGATSFGFELKYEQSPHPATADFSLNEVTA